MSIQASLENAGGNLQAVAPFDLVLAVEVVYTRPNVHAALRLLPRLVASAGMVWLAVPGRTGARTCLRERGRPQPRIDAGGRGHAA